MGCWCEELGKISGYRCVDCESVPRLSYQEKKIVEIFNKATSSGVPLAEWAIHFWKAEAIREKTDRPKGDDCPCRKQDAIWRITCRDCDIKTGWNNISEKERRKLDRFRSSILNGDSKGLQEMIKEENQTILPTGLI